ncbi:MAG TPA: FKBP-type peptidyl-prolyl cis-trans isomerase [Bacteroidales bacterium]|jgi:FKBP-type peptidyl-prolyl cis-trans isomerase FkpA|nr:FKBP-type peptidyl-prolyl cis-trans isomerase [Bacteroidales bacterium]
MNRSLSVKNPSTFIALALAVLMSSCRLSTKSDEYAEEERQMIQAYIADHDTIAFQLKNSGLYYAELKPGTGAQVDLYDTLSLVYTGRFLSGAKFDTCVGIDTLQYIINEYYSVPGFHEGLLYMKEGGKSLFLIPSGLAFGSSGTQYTGFQGVVTIPGFTPILFEVDLIKVDQYSTLK